MEFDEVLKARHSVRAFSTKKVRFEDVIAICNAALNAPAAGNIFTIRLIVVADKKKKAELAEAALGQEFIVEASYVIAVCSDTAQLEQSYGARAEIYARQQAGAAIENMLLKATSLGLGCCWVGAFEENIVERILNIPATIKVEALIPIGYERGKAKARIKPQLKQILNFESYGIKTTIPEQRETPFKK